MRFVMERRNASFCGLYYFSLTTKLYIQAQNYYRIYGKPNKIYSNTSIEYLVNHIYDSIIIYSFYLVFYTNIRIYHKDSINKNH